MIAVRNGARPRARLAALGSYVPDRVLTNHDLESMVETSDEWIVARTGIRERRIADPGVATSDLAVRAAEDVLARAGVDAADLDMVIIPTATPDHMFPSTAALVCHRIGAVRAAGYDLLAACSGFVFGLAQATALVESGLAERVLVVGSETLSHIVDWTDRATCVLFGDGAGAGLVVADTRETAVGFLGFELGTDGSGASDLIVRAGCSRLPAHEDFAREDAFLHMNGREVFKFASRVIVDSTERLLQRLEMPISDIDLMVPHQANQRIIDHAVQRLGIAPERVYANLERMGNTSSASIPIALCDARDAGRLTPGDLVLLVAFGGGLTWGSTVFRYEPVA